MNKTWNKSCARGLRGIKRVSSSRQKAEVKSSLGFTIAASWLLERSSCVLYSLFHTDEKKYKKKMKKKDTVAGGRSHAHNRTTWIYQHVCATGVNGTTVIHDIPLGKERFVPVFILFLCNLSHPDGTIDEQLKIHYCSIQIQKFFLVTVSKSAIFHL